MNLPDWMIKRENIRDVVFAVMFGLGIIGISKCYNDTQKYAQKPSQYVLKLSNLKIEVEKGVITYAPNLFKEDHTHIDAYFVDIDYKNKSLECSIEFPRPILDCDAY